MGSTFLFYVDYLRDILKHAKSNKSLPVSLSGNGENVWTDDNAPKGIVFYFAVSTIVCIFGIFGNTFSLLVLKRKELVGSVYIYLSVLAAADLLHSIMFVLQGLNKGIFHYYTTWFTYSIIIGVPVSGVINAVSVMATVAVTIDRVVFLWQPVKCSTPKFCDPKIAKEIMGTCLILSIVLNVPYCFIITRNELGDFEVSSFYVSKTYALYNWFMLLLLTIIPAVILVLGNGYLIMTLRESRKITAKCKGKRKVHTNLTITLVLIIIFFLVIEVPSSIVSRTMASSILFCRNGDPNSPTLEIVRQICALLGAVNVSVSFLLYCSFCPTFRRAMNNTLKTKKVMKKIHRLQVNVFVVGDKHAPVEKTNIFGMSRAIELSLRPEEDPEYIEIIDTGKLRI